MKVSLPVVLHRTITERDEHGRLLSPSKDGNNGMMNSPRSPQGMSPKSTPPRSPINRYGVQAPKNSNLHTRYMTNMSINNSNIHQIEADMVNGAALALTMDLRMKRRNTLEHASLVLLKDMDGVHATREAEEMRKNDYNALASNADLTADISPIVPLLQSGMTDNFAPRGRVLPVDVNPRSGWKRDLRGGVDEKVEAALMTDYALRKTIMRDREGNICEDFVDGELVCFRRMNSSRSNTGTSPSVSARQSGNLSPITPMGTSPKGGFGRSSSSHRSLKDIKYSHALEKIDSVGDDPPEDVINALEAGASFKDENGSVDGDGSFDGSIDGELGKIYMN